jgi:hypothetical protein
MTEGRLADRLAPVRTARFERSREVVATGGAAPWASATKCP